MAPRPRACAGPGPAAEFPGRAGSGSGEKEDESAAEAARRQEGRLDVHRRNRFQTIQTARLRRRGVGLRRNLSIHQRAPRDDLCLRLRARRYQGRAVRQTRGRCALPPRSGSARSRGACSRQPSKVPAWRGPSASRIRATTGVLVFRLWLATMKTRSAPRASASATTASAAGRPQTTRSSFRKS